VDTSGRHKVPTIKGYTSFIRENSTFEKLNEVIMKFRMANLPIIFVRLAFKADYSDQPKSSPVFGKAHEFGILSEGTWSTEVHASIDKKDSDTVITKNRVSAFHNTGHEVLPCVLFFCSISARAKPQSEHKSTPSRHRERMRMTSAR
jgi:nicotinamidase-related amidase